MRPAITYTPVSISLFCRHIPRESVDFWAQQREHLIATRAAACCIYHFGMVRQDQGPQLQCILQRIFLVSVTGWAERLSLECSTSPYDSWASTVATLLC